MKKFTFLMGFIALLSWQVSAQVTIGFGTEVGKAIPVEPYFGFTYSQVIYLSPEIGATGTITTLKYYATPTTVITNSNNWTIFMGHTTKTEFSSTTDWVPLASLTQAFTGIVTITAGVVTITLDTPFSYNGTDNLVIAVDENATNYNGTNDDFYSTTVATNRVLTYYSDATNPNPATPPTATNRYTSIANITLGGISQACPAPSALTATGITATSANLGWTPNGSTLWNIQWGVTGFALGTGTIITGSTTNPHSLTGLTPATVYQYYVQANCGGPGLSTWAGPYSFTTPCAIYTPNYIQNFATFMPLCWDEADAGNITTGPTSLGVGPWTNGTALGTTARINLYTNTRSDWMLSPMFNLSAGGYELSIDVAVTDWNAATPDAMGSDDSVRVVYTEDGVIWNTLKTWTAANALPNSLTNFVVPIPSTGSNVRFGILATDGPIDDVQDYDFHVDNFEVRTPPTCPAVSVLTASGITATSANLGWTPNGSTLWNIEWGVTGFTQGTGTMITGSTTNPHGLAGLSANTTYQFYVQANCGGAGLSTWAGPFSFTTPCSSVVTPWLDDVETHTATTTLTSSNCWTATASGTFDWDITGVGTTPSAGTGPNTAYSGTKYFFVEASNGVAGNVASLMTPNINLAGLIVPSLEYYYHMFGIAIGSLYVDVYNGSTWITVDSLIGQQQTTQAAAWTKRTINLSAFSGTIQVRFRAIRGNSFEGDISIDNISVKEAPTCFDPTNLTVSNLTSTSVNLGWTPNGTSLWNIEWGTSGFVQGTGTMVTGSTTNPHSLTGLTPSTAYQFYLQANCGVGGLSVWAGPYSFFTGYCQITSTSALSYVDNFTTTGGTTNISNLTSGYAVNGYQDATSMMVTHYAGGAVNFTAGFVGTTVGFNIWVDWNNDLDFDDPNEKVYASGAYVSAATGSINVPALTPMGNYRMRIRCDYNATNPNACGVSGSGRNETEDYTFVVGPMTGCAAPSILTTTGITGSSAILGWTENGTATMWNIEWGVTGFTPGSGTMITGSTTNPHNLAGLTALTTYQFYVQANCGGAITSTWVGPFSFTTTCLAPIVSSFPWTANFDGVTAPAVPCGWVIDNVNADAYTWKTSTTFASSAPNSLTITYNDVNTTIGKDDWAFSPQMNLTGGQGYLLSFAHRVQNAAYAEKLKVMFGTSPSAASMTNVLYDNTNMTNTIFATANAVFTPAVTGPYYIGFYAYSAANKWTMFLDNVTIDFSTGINNRTSNAEFMVYPNPNNGLFSVITPNGGKATVEVVNLQGKVIYKNKIEDSNHTIDLTNNAKGLYFVNITSDKGVEVHKVTVQ